MSINDDINEFKKLAGQAKDTLSVLRPGVEDALAYSGDMAAQKFEKAEKVAKALERFRGKQSANEVFSEFAKDAAEGKVVEMFEGAESSDRQRAQETVLNYALGKPVERTMSMNVQIGNMDKNEIISKILETVNQIGINVGIEGGIRKTSALVIDSQEPERREPTSELPTTPTKTRNSKRAKLPRKVLEEQEPD